VPPVFGAAAAAAQSLLPKDGVIHGCYERESGHLRIIDATHKQCHGHEVAIEWNQVGPQGPAGPPGVSGLQLISGSGVSNSSSPKSQQQDCPAGKKVIGGGAVLTGSTANTFLGASRPTDPGTGWIATGRESSGGNAGSWAVQTWVVCATVGP